MLKEESITKRQAREQLEIYLVHFFLANRFVFLIAGLLFLAYPLALTFIKPIAAGGSLLIAIYLILLSLVYRVVLITARFGAWVETLWRTEV